MAGANDDPRWRRAERKHGFQAAMQNGPAASELRRRCVLLHHGLDPLDPPNTSMWRDGLRPVASSPWVVPDGGQDGRRAGETMSRRPRRNHTPAFKAKVALAAVRGEKT